MNFGAFAGGFAQGFSLDRMMSSAEKIKKMQDDARLEVIRSQGLVDANSSREKDIEGRITENPGEDQQPKSGEIAAPYKPSTEGLPKPVISREVEVAQDASGTKQAVASESLEKPKPLLTVLGTPETGLPKGLVETGNLDINNRPVVKNPDGSISTELAFSIGIDGKEVLIPRVVGGKILTEEAAIQHFKQTGENLGTFDTPENATAYAQALHERQGQFYGSGQQPVGETTATVGTVPNPDIQQRDMSAQAQDQRFSTATGKPGEPMTQAAAPEPAQSAMSQAPAPQSAPSAPSPAPAPSSTQGAITSTGVVTEPVQPVKIQGKFVVNGKGYATKAEARKAAEADAPDVMTYYTKSVVPKMAEEFLRQGDPAKAAAWLQWGDSQEGREYMKTWHKTWMASQSGDYNAVAKGVVKLFNKYDDGQSLVADSKGDFYEEVKDKSGNLTGFNIRLKNDATGEVRSMFINPQTLVNIGVNGGSPDKAFGLIYNRQVEAEKVATQARLKEQERLEKRNDKIDEINATQDRIDARERSKGQQKLSEISLTKQLDAANLGAKEKSKIQARIDVLREQGYDDEQIKTMLPSMVNAGAYKKVTDPEERRALIRSDAMKNDPKFPRMSKEEQEKYLDDAMDTIKVKDKAGQPAAAPKAAAPAVPPDGTVLREKATGNLFIMKDGKRVPYDGKPAQAAPAPAAPAQAAPAAAAPAPAAAPPAAGGLPARPAPTPAPAAPAAPAAAPAAPQQAADPVSSQIQSQSDPTLRASHMQTYANMQANLGKKAKLDEMYRKAATMGDQASLAKLREEDAILREAIKKDRDILARFYRMPEM